MNLINLRLVLAVSGLAVASMACTKTTGDTGDTAELGDADTDADADTDSDGDADADTDSDTDTGVLILGFQGTSDDEINGVFGIWFYYYKTESRICEYDVTTTGTEPLSDCDECAFAWSAEFGEGSTRSGDCTVFGYEEGMSGEDAMGIPSIGVGFAYEAEANGNTYENVVMWQVYEGDDWGARGYADFDGAELDWTVYTSASYYY